MIHGLISLCVCNFSILCIFIQGLFMGMSGKFIKKSPPVRGYSFVDFYIILVQDGDYCPGGVVLNVAAGLLFSIWLSNSFCARPEASFI